MRARSPTSATPQAQTQPGDAVGPVLRAIAADPQAPALRPLAVHRLLALQRTHGNQYVQRRLHAVRPTAPGRISVLQQRDGGGAILGDSTVQVAPGGFSRGYAGLVHALRDRSLQRRLSGS